MTSFRHKRECFSFSSFCLFIRYQLYITSQICNEIPQILINVIIPIFCSAVILLLQRNFWLLILIEKINSTKYIKVLSKNIRILSNPIIYNSKIKPNNEDFVSKPIISITINHINSNNLTKI